MTEIKRSVSLYSLQYAYLHGKYNLRQLFELLADLEVKGVELIPDQMIRNTPNPSQEDIDEWVNLCQEFDIKPVIADVFLNTNLYHNRTLTPDECIDLLKKEIVMCSKLGFNKIRLVSMVPAFVIEPLLPYCEKYNMQLGLEIHAGLSFDKDRTREFIDEMNRLNSPYIGLVIDAGIFSRRVPKVMVEYFKNQGVNQPILDYVDTVFEKGGDGRDLFVDKKLSPEVLEVVKSDTDFMYATLASGYENEDYSVLDPYLDKIIHIHGKIYDMSEDGEYSINYKEFLDYLNKKGYDGYISTEYEGNRWTILGEPLKELENVVLHQKHLKKIINELKGEAHV